MEHALELRAAALEINRARDARLRLEQILRVGRRQGEKHDLAAGRRRRNGAHVGQMPDDVADALFGLYDDGRRHGLGSHMLPAASGHGTRMRTATTTHISKSTTAPAAKA